MDRSCKMDPEFARRYVNDGFSGGEMKRAEILQLAMLQPKFAVLDETDSGLGCGCRAAGQREHCGNRPQSKMGLLIITHHDKLLVHNPPDVTHVMSRAASIVETGKRGPGSRSCMTSGYERIRAAYPEADR